MTFLLALGFAAGLAGMVLGVAAVCGAAGCECGDGTRDACWFIGGIVCSVVSFALAYACGAALWG